MIFPDKSRV